MDPITQGTLGAVAAQAFYPKARKALSSSFVPASLIAAAAAMSPDLDVLIRSEQDPLKFLVFHRQFTHSLIFIPLGALLCALVLYPLFAKAQNFSKKETYLLCFAGYATHAVLDACTTYGTMLYWPFSETRVAWHNIAVVDLFFTLPVLLALFIGAKTHKVWWARFSIVWMLCYLSFGFLQKERAENIARAAWQGEERVLNLNAKPTMSNLWVWKIVYETEQHFYVDAVRIGLFQHSKHAMIYRGERVEKLNVARDFPWLNPDSQQAKDIKRFSWFSMGYVAKDPRHENRVMDVRYSIVPNSLDPLWAIDLNPEADAKEHVKYVSLRDVSKENRNKVWQMLRGLPLEETPTTSPL
jgi:inner membrane protein